MCPTGVAFRHLFLSARVPHHCNYHHGHTTCTIFSQNDLSVDDVNHSPESHNQNRTLLSPRHIIVIVAFQFHCALPSMGFLFWSTWLPGVHKLQTVATPHLKVARVTHETRIGTLHVGRGKNTSARTFKIKHQWGLAKHGTELIVGRKPSLQNTSCSAGTACTQLHKSSEVQGCIRLVKWPSKKPPRCQ